MEGHNFGWRYGSMQCQAPIAYVMPSPQLETDFRVGADMLKPQTLVQPHTTYIRKRYARICRMEALSF